MVQLYMIYIREFNRHGVTKLLLLFQKIYRTYFQAWFTRSNMFFLQTFGRTYYLRMTGLDIFGHSSNIFLSANNFL